LFVCLFVFLQGTAGEKGEMGLPGDTGKPVNLIQRKNVALRQTKYLVFISQVDF